MYMQATIILCTAKKPIFFGFPLCFLYLRLFLSLSLSFPLSLSLSLSLFLADCLPPSLSLSFFLPCLLISTLYICISNLFRFN